MPDNRAAKNRPYSEAQLEKVHQLREKTGEGMMDCKKALQKSDWDMAEAEAWLNNPGRLSLYLVNRRTYL